MKKFFIKCFMIVLPALLIMLLPALPENSYHLAVIDKQKTLAGAKSPKIVFAGGSNLAFGIDSREIGNAFNLPVVNMGVQAGFGLGRILDHISPYLNSGDLLIVVPEYQHFTTVWSGEAAAYELIFDARQYRLLWSGRYGLPRRGMDVFLSTRLRGIVRRFMKTPDENVYLRDDFNEYGDSVKHLGRENRSFEPMESIGDLNQAYINNFFKFTDDFAGRGITVALSYPCYEERSFLNSAAAIQELDTLLRAQKNLLVISTPQSYCLPANLFYDTAYHLNMEGRNISTNQIIRDMKAAGLFTR